MTIKYFLNISGIPGDSLDPDHEGWFDIDAYHFETKAGAGVLSGTGGSGKPGFSNLSLDLPEQYGLAELMKAVVTGKTFVDAELLAYDTNTAQTVYDIQLQGVGVVAASDNSFGESTATLSFNRLTESVGGDAVTYDRKGIRVTGTVEAPTKTPVTPFIGDYYFLTVAGIAGDSSAAGHIGAFDIDSYHFETKTAPGALGVAPGSGKSSFSDLMLELPETAGVTQLLRTELVGKHIASAELKGVHVGVGGVETQFYDLALTDVAVTKLNESSGEDSKLSLHFRTMTETVGDSSVRIDTRTYRISGVVGPTAETGGPPTRTLHYFMKVDGISGDTSASDHGGWFDLNSYEFHISRLPSGRAIPSDVDISLGETPGVTQLLRTELAGKHIKSIEIVGIDYGNDGPPLQIVDLKLSNALIRNFAETGVVGDGLGEIGKASMSLQYGRIEDVLLGQTFKWDVRSNTV